MESSKGEIDGAGASVFSGGSVLIFDPNPSFTFCAGKTQVTIKPDGTIIYGEGYTPDEAARAFWDAVGLERKERK
jgi:hypothetical protein